MSAFPSLVQPSFQLVAEPGSDGSVVVRFSGTADMHTIDALDGYLGTVHALALETHAQRVTMDFRKLEFMNSSCFKSFVSWIGRVQELPAAAQYRIEFKSNPQMHWQRRSLNALRCFAADLVTVQA